MSGIFIYADNPGLSAELLTLARELGQTSCLIGLHEADAGQLAQLGTDKVFLLKGESNWPENYSRAMADLLESEGAELLLVGATVRGRDIAARIAAYLKCGLAGDVASVSRVNNAFETSRLMYGGAVVQTSVLQGFNVITIPAGKNPAAAAAASTSEIMVREVKADTQVALLETVAAEKKGADLAKAERVVCIGLGFDQQSDLQMIEDLTGALGAVLACTRPIAEERGWLPAESYIGISGKSIKPEIYIGMGLSGQVQHTVGIRDAKIIVAINNNEMAPIFRIADYGIVGDMYEIVPLLTQAVKNA
jgi:electron transfer flavoprotein alpha subunit